MSLSSNTKAKPTKLGQKKQASNGHLREYFNSDSSLLLQQVLNAVGTTQAVLIEQIKAGTFPMPISNNGCTYWNAQIIQQYLVQHNLPLLPML